MGSRKSVLCILFLWSVLTTVSKAQNRNEYTYYSTPTPDVPCPAEPCHTLSEYAKQPSQYFASNTTLVFLPGDHTLTTTVLLENFNNLTILGGFSSLLLVSSRIVCGDSASVILHGIAELYVRALAVFSCGSLTGASVEVSEVSQAIIENCTFRDGKIGALTVTNSDIIFLDSVFENNSGSFGSGVYIDQSIVTIIRNHFKGNFVNGVGGTLAVINSSLTLSDTKFDDNNVIGTAYSHGGGLYVSNITADVFGNYFINNSASGWGGGVYIEASTVSFTHNLFFDNVASFGGGAEVAK